LGPPWKARLRSRPRRRGGSAASFRSSRLPPIPPKAMPPRGQQHHHDKTSEGQQSKTQQARSGSDGSSDEPVSGQARRGHQPYQGRRPGSRTRTPSGDFDRFKWCVPCRRPRCATAARPLRVSRRRGQVADLDPVLEQPVGELVELAEIQARGRGGAVLLEQRQEIAQPAINAHERRGPTASSKLKTKPCYSLAISSSTASAALPRP
jgi:hypothetical protein